MPGTPTTKYVLPTLAGSDIGNTIDDWSVSFAAAVDSKLAPSDQGNLASRPVSTVGSPGKSGRTYYATDTGELFRDNGTGWDTVLTSTQAARLGLNTDGVVRRGKSIIAAAEPRGNVAFGLLGTPDRVQNVVLPTDGLIRIAYQAMWKESVAGAASAAIFIGGNRLKARQLITNAFVGDSQGAQIGIANFYNPLFSFSGGLRSVNGGAVLSGDHPDDVTTGQIVGGQDSAGVSWSAGQVTVFAAAGTYDVSVQFLASSGTVTAKNRKLWVETIGF